MTRATIEFSKGVLRTPKKPDIRGGHPRIVTHLGGTTVHMEDMGDSARVIIVQGTGEELESIKVLTIEPDRRVIRTIGGKKVRFGYR